MGLCVICAEEGSDKVEKDENFVKMMGLYWKGLQVDVKPESNKDFDLCIECFDSILQFYQVHDLLVFFETRLKQLRHSILSKNLLGIRRCQEKELTLNRLQRDIVNEWGTSIEVTQEIEAADKILETYKVTLDFEDPNQPNLPNKNASKKSKTEGKKKLAANDAAESTESSREASKSPVKKSKGRSKITKRRGRGADNKRRRMNSSEAESESGDDDSEDEEDSDETSSTTSNEDASDDLLDEMVEPRVTRRASKTKPGRVDAASWTQETECKLCLDRFPTFTAYQKHFKSHKGDLLLLSS